MSYGQRRNFAPHLIIGLLIALFSLFRYFGSSQTNVVTGQKQHVGSISPSQEIALGLQAAPRMEQQYGGESQSQAGQALVEKVGQRIVTQSSAKDSPYKYDFHLLADPKTINAFALPGGQVFITEGLARKLKTEGMIAGVLSHEIGHVVARHSAQQIAKQQLTQGLTGAAVLATYDPNNSSSRNSAAVAMAIGQMVNMKFGRNDESEADKLGVKLMSQSNYDPRGMLEVMKVLESAGGGRQPEFFSTHPNPEHRYQRIQGEIKALYPSGIPADMSK